MTVADRPQTTLAPDALPAAPTPRLTKLELHGFKSFQSRTVFAFEPGITAIVGPNGSGKSNVADAVRWVLGEQGQSALRARRTEDVIFAGGQGRAPAGLAEATLTFDNTDRWLPIEFTEVTVTRRAFRSGENHYLINGKRVRLKDVALLTASLGQSHVVVGQGLVDAALSQRAEERRALFEHAADLAGLRLKVAEAERSLTETESNSARLTDLLTELEPRLRSLERAARQAREWQSVRDRLQVLQRNHFSRRLTGAAARTEAAEHTMTGSQQGVVQARVALDKLTLEAGMLSRDRDQAQTALTEHDAAQGGATDRLRSTEHERDLAAERAAALARRADDMADTREGLETRAAAVTADLEQVTAELSAIDQAFRDTDTQTRDQERHQAEQRQRRQALDRQVRHLDAARAEAERELAGCSRDQALLEQRAETLAGERERLLAEAAGRRDRLDRLIHELAGLEAGEHQAAESLRRLEQQIAELAAKTEQSSRRLAAATAAVAERDQLLGHVTTRLDALSKMHESGAGLHAGVREVLTTARSGGLAGILGTVAELVAVPAALDAAIEVALGSRLQDIVVERWADAEAAISHLKRSRAGRATFQPLDTVRGGNRSDSRLDHALRLPGTRGIAAELVQADARLAHVVSALLGRTLVVDDLTAARQALPHLPSGWSAVTIAGEIARSGGSVTGGTAARESGLLARERELRELPDEIGRLREARERDEAERLEATADATTTERAHRDAVTERATVAASAHDQRRQRERLATWIEELRRDLGHNEVRLGQNRDETATLAAEQQRLGQRTSELETNLAETADRMADLVADRQREDELTAGAERETAALRQRRAGLEERRRAEQRRLAELRSQEQALAAELQLRAERVALVEQERRGQEETHRRLAAEADQLRRQQAALTDARYPLQAEARRLEAAIAHSNRAIAAAREALLEREREQGASELALERARDDVESIRRQIGQELELDDPDELLTRIAADDGHEDDEPAREREIQRLRDRLRRVGFVGQDVVAEYEREAEHQAFVRQQLADVQGAGASLRSLLADLQTTMRARFDATFAQVSAVFAEMFSELFGGGTAQLTLTGGEPNENGTRSEPGVDIVAQPPGKRLQSLALLSGGERALTAVALLFAILRVNPAPFCLLDEVDAALDEANVVRFRDQLGDLAAKTQVVIITHNRGTIEIADTLYGVSMAADGVSRVLSLRMAEQGSVADE